MFHKFFQISKLCCLLAFTQKDESSEYTVLSSLLTFDTFSVTVKVMALLGSAVRGRLKLALAPSWSVVRAVCQARVGAYHGSTSPRSSRVGTLQWTTPSRHSSPQLLQPPTAIVTLARSYAKSKDRKGKGRS